MIMELYGLPDYRNPNIQKSEVISSDYKAQRDELLATLEALENRSTYLAKQCGYYESEIIELVAAKELIEKLTKCEQK